MAEPLAMLYPIYRFATAAAEGLFERLLRRRLAAGKEDSARIDERRGVASRPRPPGTLLWLHAASVGEANSLLPLITALRERSPETTLLLTTGTATSATLMAQRLPEGVIHQFVPLDAPAWVARFFAHWKPAFGILVESELWPNLLAEAKQNGVTLALLNGRLSEKSAARWRALRPLAKPMMESFALIGAQSAEDATRFTAIGARNVRLFGNLKYAGAALPIDTAKAKALRTAIGDRPVWLFASTHEGEEEIALRLHRTVSKERTNLLTIIAPRHPARADSVFALAMREDFAIRRRSIGDLPRETDEFYLADTLGELGTFFDAVKIVAMGGSFAAHGGHNPLEPAASGCAVIAGPHMENFAAIAARLETANALVRVVDETALTETVQALFADPAHTARLGANGKHAVAAEADVLNLILAALDPLLAKAAEVEQ